MTDVDTRFPVVDGNILDLLADVARCDEDRCPVKQKHPYYPTPSDPPYLGKRACLPVTPTYAAKGGIMLLGEYPNCRFASKPAPNPTTKRGKPYMAPVADINEPFESGRYFDGRTVIKYPTGESLIDRYLRPLGIDLEQDIWFTNLVKCYLIDESDIEAYRNGFGWIDANGEWVDETGETHTVENTKEGDYNKAAALCVQRYLRRELELCKPKLIIAFGLKVHNMIHSDANWQPAAFKPGRWDKVMGQLLLANQQGDPELDTRNALFFDYNVVHLTHPSAFLFAMTQNDLDKLIDTHRKHIAAASGFLAQFGYIPALPECV